MNSISHPIARKIFGGSLIGLSFACSACTTVSQPERLRLSENPVQAIYKESATDPSLPKTARRGRLQASPSSSSMAPSSVPMQVHRDPAFQQIAYSPDQAMGMPQNGFAPANAQYSPAAYQVQSCPPDPRFPAAGPYPMGPGMMAYDVVNLPSPSTFPDEYLCDGGDRDNPVHYDDITRMGLDTEDTVLEFTDRSGKERMKPSNKVCIYAPRFASVRTVSRPHEGMSTNEVAGIGHLASTKGMHTRLKATNEVQIEATSRVAVRSRAGGVETEAVLDSVKQLHSPLIHDKLLNLHQTLAFVRTGKLDDTESLKLNKGIQAASIWTREQFPVIAAKSDAAMEGHYEEASATITAIDEKEEAENLRIVKLADKQTATTGDEIQFTIRYDNLGGMEVHHIRIVDNLTPRLAYVDDSATSDRAGRLLLQDNGEGSQVLVWEIDEPLQGKTGGVVTFKARVR